MILRPTPPPSPNVKFKQVHSLDQIQTCNEDYMFYLPQPNHEPETKQLGWGGIIISKTPPQKIEHRNFPAMHSP
jgi:hypothetical protein